MCILATTFHIDILCVLHNPIIARLVMVFDRYSIFRVYENYI